MASKLKNIELDLDNFKVQLNFQDDIRPLIIHFDTPSRRFYFAVISLVVNEMQKLKRPEFIHLRRHEKTLKLLDSSLAGKYASKETESMWGKIRKTWRYNLADLEEATHFSIEDRTKIPPYEKRGRYRYDCSDDECDIWANLFEHDESNKWRFKFAIDSASLELNDIHLSLSNLKDNDAWKSFVDNIRKTQDPSHHKIKYKQTTKPVSLYRPIPIIIIILIVSGLVSWYFYIRSISEQPSIAVLPFVNISGDPDKEYLCDGITEDLINNLARIKDLRVISRTSAFYFKDKGLDIRTIREKLNVENILEGSVRISGDNLKVTAQLVKVADDSHVWAEAYDRGMKNIFEIQEKLAQEIVCKLKPRLGCKRDKRLTKDYTQNLQAYNMYLKGRALWKNRWSKKSLKSAIEYFEKAIEIDPNYALAYAGLADLYNEVGFFFAESVRDYHLKAKDAALKALEIDAILAEAHAALGFNRLIFEWNWKGAEESCKRAIDLNPGSSVAHKNLSITLRSIGRIDEAIREMELSLDLDPFSLEKLNQYVITLRQAGQPNKAIHQAIKVLELYPNHPNAITFLGSLYSEVGNFEKGIPLLKKAVILTKRQSPFALGFLGLAYAFSGDVKNAEKIIDELIERSNQGQFVATMIASIYNGLNDKDKAFEWIEKAYNIRDPRLFCLKVISHLKPLHSDPRWPEVMKKMGLE